MINKEDNYVEWALLLAELEEAHEHLAALMDDLQRSDQFSENDYRVQMGHIYAHLNRAWRKRLAVDGNSAEKEISNEFPQDLEPLA